MPTKAHVSPLLCSLWLSLLGACGAPAEGPEPSPAATGAYASPLTATSFGPACTASQLDCDRNPENGCEADTRGDRFHCGACGKVCPPGAACSAGVCGPACPAGQADCDGNPANGCESASGPLAYYRMNEGGLVSVADSAGMAGHLLLDDTQTQPSFVLASPPGTTPGGYALRCPLAPRICARSTQPLRLPRATHLTLQAWVRATDLHGSPVSFMPIGGRAPFFTLVTDSVGNLAGTLWSGDSYSYTLTAPGTASTLKDGRWHLWAMTGDGSSLRLFLDGAQVATRALPYTSIQPVRTGYVQVVNVTRGDVDIDEVKLYSYARGATEIASDALTFCRAPAGCGACTAPARAVPLCEGTRCSFRCLPGWADCDGNAANGCEVDLSNTATSCGACGNVCPGGTAARCQAGFCSECTCAAGTANCNRDCSDACETKTQDDLQNCGACGRTCSLPHATAACTAGACAVGRCDSGWGDCDGKPENGCEVDLTRSADHCGTCGRGCGPGGLCAAGTCKSAMCSASIRDCDGSAANGCEADIESDPSNCGACGRACRTAPNEQTTCQAGGLCGLRCLPGWGDCDGSLTNGCESDLLRDPTHCGSCTGVCRVPNATAACGPSGTCIVGRCNRGWRQCGAACVGMYDPKACGPSCAPCPTVPNAYATCNSNYCGFTCSTGFHDCDGKPENGCESRSEPVAWWRMDEGYDRNIADSSRENVTASLRGFDDRWSTATPPGSRDGMSVECNWSGGSDGGRCMEALLRWQWDWPFTLQAWIRGKPVTSTVEAVNIGSHVSLSILPDGRVASVTQKTITGTTNVLDGAWHRIAIVGDGKLTRVYVDGFLEGSGAYTSTRPGFDPATVYIGKGLRGEIDDVKIYNYPRTIAEIGNDALTFCRAP